MMLAAAVLLLTLAPGTSWSGTLHQTFIPSDGRLQHASVYLPHGYHDDESRRYPTLILLHGLGGDDEGWFAGGYLVDILDQAIYSGRIQPMIVVIRMVGMVTGLIGYRSPVQSTAL